MRWRIMLVDQLQLASGLKRVARCLRLVFVVPVLAVAGLVSNVDLAVAQRRPIEATKPIMRGESGSFVPGRAIVALKPGVTEADAAAVLKNAGVEIVRPLRL